MGESLTQAQMRRVLKTPGFYFNTLDDMIRNSKILKYVNRNLGDWAITKLLYNHC